jgi:hypothetical protein
VRALLVANPHATTTTAAGRDVIARAMAGEVKLDVLQTERRGHAAEADRTEERRVGKEGRAVCR